MDITVILCTHNRKDLLAKSLGSLARQEIAASITWEVLVVDNNSSDSTPSVVDELCIAFPGRFRYLFEPQVGKSHALNTGIREAQGRLLAFVDDDVIVEPTWLQNLTVALKSSDWAGAGGRILPIWNCAPPEWLPRFGKQALGPLVGFEPGLEAGPLLEPPFGTNMAFRKVMFEKYGGFRTDLGPRPNSEIRSEDTEFGSRLLAAGEHLRYEPSATVYHPVPPNRLRKAYFLDWWFDKARADIRQFGIPSETRWSIYGVPACFIRRVITWALRWLVAFGPSQRFSCKINVWINAGRSSNVTNSHVAGKAAAVTSLIGTPAPARQAGALSIVKKVSLIDDECWST